MRRSTHPRSWGRQFAFIPFLENLADRTVPSVTTSFDNGVLTLTGDDTASTVTITAEGSGSYSVDLGDGSTPETFDDVTEIDATLGSGDDSLTIDLGDVAKKTDLTLDLDAGDGANSIDVTADSIAKGASIDATITTGLSVFTAMFRKNAESSSVSVP